MHFNQEVHSTEDEAFKRSFLEAMRNMVTVATYALGGSYLVFGKYDSALFGRVFSVIIGIALYGLSAKAATYNIDFLHAAFLRRYPDIERSKLILAGFVAVVGAVGMTPSYIFLSIGTH